MFHAEQNSLLTNRRQYMDDDNLGTVISAVATLIIIIVCCFVRFSTPTSGEKTGIIIKVSQEGIIWKTWEAELIRGGMSSGSGGFGVKPFDFTISDASTLQKAQDALNNGSEVLIKYHNNFISSRASTATKDNTF